jgi:hypothetical protein
MIGQALEGEAKSPGWAHQSVAEPKKTSLGPHSGNLGAFRPQMLPEESSPHPWPSPSSQLLQTWERPPLALGLSIAGKACGPGFPLVAPTAPGLPRDPSSTKRFSVRPLQSSQGPGVPSPQMGGLHGQEPGSGTGEGPRWGQPPGPLSGGRFSWKKVKCC